MRRCVFLSVVAVAIVAVLVALPRGVRDGFELLPLRERTDDISDELLRERTDDIGNELLPQERTDGVGDELLVWTFNIRHDAVERNPDNDFTKRVHRLASLLNTWKPAFVGVQEPSSVQMVRLGKELTYAHGVVGFEGNADIDRTDPRRRNDFQTSILYNRDVLELAESDHVWLSETPRVPESYSWDAEKARTLTIGRFVWKANGKTVLVFNTHFDCWGERARREAAAIVVGAVAEWAARFPGALVFVTGDFNSANGQAPHRILTAAGADGGGGSKSGGAGGGLQLHDVWEVCQQRPGCVSNNVAPTFHAWFGSLANSYAVRVGQYLAHGVHGSGLDLLNMPQTFSGVAGRLMEFDPLKAYAALPNDMGRMHVDWILFGMSGSGGDSGSGDGGRCVPTAAVVGEVRRANFSSDHFPVAAFMQCKF